MEDRRFSTLMPSSDCERIGEWLRLFRVIDYPQGRDWPMDRTPRFIKHRREQEQLTAYGEHDPRNCK